VGIAYCGFSIADCRLPLPQSIKPPFGLPVRTLGPVIAALSLCLACGQKSTSKHATSFPQSNEVQGWSKSGETRIFPSARLWEYIDGDADKYLQAGVDQTLTTDYRYGGKIEAVADIFIMSDAAGATRVFELQPPTGSQSIPLGDAARLYNGSLTFRKGRYFVRLVAYQNAPEISQALVALGRAISIRLE
jgi:hypothetical protein